MTVFFIIVICVIIEVCKAFKEAMKPKIECHIISSLDDNTWDDALREKYGTEIFNNWKESERKKYNHK